MYIGPPCQVAKTIFTLAGVKWLPEHRINIYLVCNLSSKVSIDCLPEGGAKVIISNFQKFYFFLVF